MRDLRDAGCDLLTLTQYLRPTPRHHPVERWVKPEEFVELREEALGLGFAGVMSGPLVRASYRGGRLYAQGIEQRAAAAGTRGANRRHASLRSGTGRFLSGAPEPYAAEHGTHVEKVR